MAPQVIVIELNEFNVELLSQASSELNLPNIRKIMSLPGFAYRTDDTYDSGFLEPWVQWSSIHLGVPSSEHGIKNLGEVAPDEFPAIWESLDRQGVTTGVFGCMNGVRKKSTHNLFFLPDPWVYAEAGYPDTIANLLRLPRYVSKNYRDIRFPLLMKELVTFIKSVISLGMVPGFIKMMGTAMWQRFKGYKTDYTLIVPYEVMAIELFIKLLSQKRPEVSFLFINSLAHLQHHYWVSGKISSEIGWGLQKIDSALGRLLEQFPDASFVVHNGLSQMNTNHEPAWVLYRQKNPEEFFKALGIVFSEVEQNMTHDGHLLFKTEQDLNNGIEILESACVNEDPLFLVERRHEGNLSLFYRLDYTDELGDEAIMKCEDRHFRFFDLFDRVVVRTGKHIPRGHIFSDKIDFDGIQYNHEFNRYLLEYIGERAGAG
jgi:hypothetical protein